MLFPVLFGRICKEPRAKRSFSSAQIRGRSVSRYASAPTANCDELTSTEFRILVYIYLQTRNRSPKLRHPSLNFFPERLSISLPSPLCQQRPNHDALDDKANLEATRQRPYSCTLTFAHDDQVEPLCSLPGNFLGPWTLPLCQGSLRRGSRSHSTTLLVLLVEAIRTKAMCSASSSSRPAANGGMLA